jgi:hypothetical protein
MRRSHDVGQAGEQAGSTGTGPGTAAGAQATGGGQPVSTESGTPYTTTTTAGTRERGSQEPAGYGRGQPSGHGRAPMEAGTTTVHGGLYLTVAGLLTFLVGLAFVVRHGFYHSFAGYAYNWGIVSWGWVLFGLGIATFAVGVSHLLGLPMSRPVGILMSVLTIVAGFMIVPFYLIWGVIIVALGVAALWGLAHGAERESQKRELREYERDSRARM